MIALKGCKQSEVIQGAPLPGGGWVNDIALPLGLSTGGRK
jgi:hypothetical protein